MAVNNPIDTVFNPCGSDSASTTRSPYFADFWNHARAPAYVIDQDTGAIVEEIDDSRLHLDAGLLEHRISAVGTVAVRELLALVHAGSITVDASLLALAPLGVVVALAERIVVKVKKYDVSAEVCVALARCGLAGVGAAYFNKLKQILGDHRMRNRAIAECLQEGVATVKDRFMNASYAVYVEGSLERRISTLVEAVADQTWGMGYGVELSRDVLHGVPLYQIEGDLSFAERQFRNHPAISKFYENFGPAVLSQVYGVVLRFRGEVAKRMDARWIVPSRIARTSCVEECGLKGVRELAVGSGANISVWITDRDVEVEQEEPEPILLSAGSGCDVGDSDDENGDVPELEVLTDGSDTEEDELSAFGESSCGTRDVVYDMHKGEIVPDDVVRQLLCGRKVLPWSMHWAVARARACLGDDSLEKVSCKTAEFSCEGACAISRIEQLRVHPNEPSHMFWSDDWGYHPDRMYVRFASGIGCKESDGYSAVVDPLKFGGWECGVREDEEQPIARCWNGGYEGVFNESLNGQWEYVGLHTVEYGGDACTTTLDFDPVKMEGVGGVFHLSKCGMQHGTRKPDFGMYALSKIWRLYTPEKVESDFLHHYVGQIFTCYSGGSRVQAWAVGKYFMSNAAEPGCDIELDPEAWHGCGDVVDQEAYCRGYGFYECPSDNVAMGIPEDISVYDGGKVVALFYDEKLEMSDASHVFTLNGAYYVKMYLPLGAAGACLMSLLSGQLVGAVSGIGNEWCKVTLWTDDFYDAVSEMVHTRGDDDDGVSVTDSEYDAERIHDLSAWDQEQMDVYYNTNFNYIHFPGYVDDYADYDNPVEVEIPELEEVNPWEWLWLDMLPQGKDIDPELMVMPRGWKPSAEILAMLQQEGRT